MITERHIEEYLKFYQTIRKKLVSLSRELWLFSYDIKTKPSLVRELEEKYSPAKVLFSEYEMEKIKVTVECWIRHIDEGISAVVELENRMKRGESVE